MDSFLFFVKTGPWAKGRGVTARPTFIILDAAENIHNVWTRGLRWVPLTVIFF